jgi:hypothetical protein
MRADRSTTTALKTVTRMGSSLRMGGPLEQDHDGPGRRRSGGSAGARLTNSMKPGSGVL